MSKTLDLLLYTKYNKFQTFFIKKYAKSSYLNVNIEIELDRRASKEESQMNSKEKRFYDYFCELIRNFKSEGLSKDDIILKLDKEFKEYNIKLVSLPKLVYELYSDLK